MTTDFKYAEKRPLSIKVPVDIAQEMDERGQFNSYYFTKLIVKQIHNAVLENLNKPVGKLFVSYTFRAPIGLIDILNDYASFEGLSTNEYVGRILKTYYTGENLDG